MYSIKAVRGDITKPLGVQAIVNAANTSLLGGCETGQAKLTKAYNSNLPREPFL